MRNLFRRMTALLLALTSAFTMSNVSFAEDSHFEYITSHIDLAVPQTLNITKPSEDIAVSSANYYITGTSDPNHPLYIGYTEVSGRGKFGSFGVYVNLDPGENLFTFTNGDNIVSVCITRVDPAASAAVPVSTISGMYPSVDSADFYGNKIELSCVAPSGAYVTATVNSQIIELTQAAATEQRGIAATFRAEYTLPDAYGTVSLGPVTYTMTFDGKETVVQSAGELITVGDGNDLVVECTQVSAGVVREPGGPYIATAKLGARDKVIAVKGSHYQLSMGGWISKSNVEVLLGEPEYHNTIDSVTFSQEDGAEIISLIGSSNAFVQSWVTDDTLYINIFNTDGLKNLDVSRSSLYEYAIVTQNVGGSTTIRLKLKPEAELWGHTVQYFDGVIEIISKYRPQLTGNEELPLEGIVVALDAGHGLSDPGALGTAQLTGPTEAQINRATAEAVKKQLEFMGATVHLLEALEHNNLFNERMQPAIDTRADFFISLHCNATVANYNGTLANGAEVYYYENSSKALGQSIIETLAPYTGRRNRGTLFYEFRVTLNSLAPSVLVEMGFMSNPGDYDDLCSKEGIYNTALAIGDALVKNLSVNV